MRWGGVGGTGGRDYRVIEVTLGGDGGVQYLIVMLVSQAYIHVKSYNFKYVQFM